MSEEPEVFVVEELSRRTQVSVRSLRSYQSRGLLPPPELRGRTGWYGPQHVARVRLIQDLRAAGMKLDGIARMLDEDPGADEQLLAFTQQARGMFGDPAPRVTTVEELIERFQVRDDEAIAVVEAAVRLGLLRETPDGQVEELAPRLLAAGEAAMRSLQLTATEALDLLGRLRRHADGVAKIYVELFVERVWEPFVASGRPPEQWADVQRSLDALRDLATEALDATFELAMSRRVDQTLGRGLLDPGAG
ncbi:MerR family transcriptional regulator [Nocardioides dongkuii]|uniref:MerR family transcriptional regulator n=1 Tax=Nocardioides dongkuii TaxID=2760089 RepID=UPI0015F8A7F2|nr:MerR family transcriptional regulator [Nocardioides dongkuii]